MWIGDLPRVILVRCVLTHLKHERGSRSGWRGHVSLLVWFAVEVGPRADEAGGEPGVREPDPGRNRGDLQGPSLAPAVMLLRRPVGHRHLIPGQARELVVQRRPVPLDDEHLTAAVPVQAVRRLSLCAQRIRGHHHAGQVVPAQHRCECGDLVALGLRGHLSHRDPRWHGPRH